MTRPAASSRPRRLVQLLQKAKAAYDLPPMLHRLDFYSLLVIDVISYLSRS